MKSEDSKMEEREKGRERVREKGRQTERGEMVRERRKHTGKERERGGIRDFNDARVSVLKQWCILYGSVEPGSYKCNVTNTPINP